MAGPLLSMMSQMGGMAFGSQLGQALGKLSREVLTSTDIGLPLGPKGVAALMPEAVESLAEGLEQPRSEILTFLAAREAAHHRLFSHVPWLSSQLLNAVEAFAKGMKIDMSGIEEFAKGFNPASLADPVRHGAAAQSGHLRAEGHPRADGGPGTARDTAGPDRGLGADRGHRRPRRPHPGHRRAQRDAAPPPRHRRAGRADVRHAGGAGTAAAQDARGRRAVGEADRRRSAPTPATRSGSTPTCCPAPTDLDEPAGFIDRIVGGDTSGIDEAIEQTLNEGATSTTARPPHGVAPPRPRPVDNSAAGPLGVAQSIHDRDTRSTRRCRCCPRPDGTVQVGWDPRRAVLVHPPPGLTAAALAELLRAMQSAATRHELRTARLPAAAADAAVADWTRHSARGGRRRRRGAPRRTRSASIRVHGRGPLSDLLASVAALLGCAGQPDQQNRMRPPATTDLVVLSDYPGRRPAGGPRAARRRGRRICRCGCATATGLVGPLVIPGVTSCLGCADLHRSDRDAAWPAVAAQLRGTVGTADRATVLATAALALTRSTTSSVRCARRRLRRASDPACSPVDDRHHPGIRPHHRLDRGPQMVAAPQCTC